MPRIAAALFLLVTAPACGGNVDDQRSATTTGASGSTGSSGMPLACGETPTEGQIVTACIPMNGDFCLPAQTSPGLLVELAGAQGVCPETSPTACCGKDAYRQVVCDHPPGVSDCCYDVHFIEKVVCP